jgi:hypothetical protein
MTEHPENEAGNYFGCCPQCGGNDGYLNLGRTHWFYCKTHKVTWCIGDNLFSSWQEETPEDWNRNKEYLTPFAIIEASEATDGVDWNAVDSTAVDLLGEVLR